MRQHGYHGGFKHPVRSFVIGTTLIVLLFCGFVAGIELSSPPTGAATTTRLVAGTATEVTVTSPGVTETVPGKRQVVTRIQYLPGGVRVLHVMEKSGKEYVIRYATTTGPADGGVARPIASTVYSTLTESATATETATATVTETATATVTETVTETTPTSESSQPSSP
jgi:hypothetical protein